MYTNWNGDPLPIKSVKWMNKEDKFVWNTKKPNIEIKSNEYVVVLAVRC